MLPYGSPLASAMLRAVVVAGKAAGSVISMLYIKAISSTWKTGAVRPRPTLRADLGDLLGSRPL